MTDDLICVDANFVVRLVTSQSTNSVFVINFDTLRSKF